LRWRLGLKLSFVVALDHSLAHNDAVVFCR